MAREFGDDIDELLSRLVSDDKAADRPIAGEMMGESPEEGPQGITGAVNGAANRVQASAAGEAGEVLGVVRGERRRRRRLVAVLLASAAINSGALVVAFLWWTGRIDLSAGGGAATAAGGTAVVGEGDGGVTGDGGADTGSSTTAAGSTTEQEVPTAEAAETITSVAPTPANPDGAVRYAIFSGDKIYLRGLVPSQDIADQHLASAEAVIGPGNVIEEYDIDPAAPAQAVETPIYIEDAVLFEFNSAEIAPDFYPILDLITIFLSQNPESSITVVARTDAAGPEELNLEIATDRAQAVIDYWVASGVSPDQVSADPRGEEGASPDDDPETAAGRRRVELVIKNLLQTP